MPIEDPTHSSVSAVPRLDEAAHAALTGFVNHLLADEAWARERLQAHVGKTVCLAAPPFAVTLAVMESGLLGAATEATQADVVLTLPLVSLPLIAAGAITSDDPQSAVLRHARIEGDADLAQVVAALFQHLRWDVEEDLSRGIGDVAAHRVARAVHAGIDATRATSARLIGNVVEYLTEEQPMLVTRAQIDGFAADVVRLREDLERLDKRIARLPR